MNLSELAKTYNLNKESLTSLTNYALTVLKEPKKREAFLNHPEEAMEIIVNNWLKQTEEFFEKVLTNGSPEQQLLIDKLNSTNSK